MDMGGRTIRRRARASDRMLVAVVTAAALAGGAVAGLPALTGAQSDGAVTLTTQTDALGTYLVGPEGMTLYYFTRDVTPGVSVCYGGCAEAWPPLLVDEGQALAGADDVTGPLGVIERTDGTRMGTYRGRPLYYWASDTAPGDTTGQGVGNVWFVASVDGSMPANPPALTVGLADGAEGPMLVGKDGLTVYLFTKDETPGQSVCTGGCLEKWPPVTVAAGNTVAAGEGVTGVLGLIPAASGAQQVTYDGRPLYYFQGDTEAGQTNGQGVGDVWYVVAP